MSSQLEQHCGNCGLLLAPGSTTCPRCGAPVSAAPSSSPQAPSGPPSEFFPNFQYDVNEAATIVHEGPFPGWGQPSPLPGTPSGTLPPAQPAPSGSLPQPPAGSSGQITPGTPDAVSGGMAPSGGIPAWQQESASKGTPAPEFPGAPAQPGWNPGMMPGQGAMPVQSFPSGGMPTGTYIPGYDMQPGVMMPTAIPPAKPPLPRWFTAGAVVLVALGLFLIWLVNSEWADGARLAGIAAFVVAAVVLGVFAFRYINGYRATRAIGLTVASILVLVALGTAGIGLRGTFQQLQGKYLDGQQNFDAAIREFQNAGDNTGVARTYNDKGEYLLNQKNYRTPDELKDPNTGKDIAATGGALFQFQFVISTFAKSTDLAVQAQVSRAKEGAANTYLAWGDQKLNQSNYQDAVDRFALALQDTTDFEGTTAFPKIRQEAAKAYLGLGKKQESDGACADAAASFTILVTSFSDTPDSQEAQTELKKPQDIIGRVINVTTGQAAPNVRLFLSSRWQVQNGVFSASDDTSTTSDANGNFTFKGIVPGDTKYLISYVGTNGQETITVSRASGQPQNVVQVAPICAPDPVTVLQF